MWVSCAAHLGSVPRKQVNAPLMPCKTVAQHPTTRHCDSGCRFEGGRGLPKMSQTRPREAGHKPAFLMPV
ncbi:hypothetical protein CCU68_34850 [Pseudomonas gingeri NCPPB 3146 = LMG 5327]|uniref:Uncharacterized protein n=1 Tax=Pseudomonas gingeri NCPPB 3146 = LMG 5327 TaxID=707248 RepID=A0ABX4XSZ3_9PSED|nr:hypothetical protein CCU68_34850 [Pseudomonas gingeri NCPPB 3146 = LMG 5327]